MSQKGKQWFKDMGSKEIENLKYRHGFAFIGVCGRLQAHEKIAQSKKELAQVTQAFNVNPLVVSQFSWGLEAKGQLNTIKNEIWRSLGGLRGIVDEQIAS